jgi:hypothetical protein
VNIVRDWDLPPDVGGDLDDEAELGDLVVVAEQVALDRGREPTLR